MLCGEVFGSGPGLEEEAEHIAEFRQLVRVKRGFQRAETFFEQRHGGVPLGFALRGQHDAGAAAVFGDRLAFQDPACDVQVDRLGDRAGAQARVLGETLDLGDGVGIFQKILDEGELGEGVVSVQAEHADRGGTDTVRDK